MHECECEMTQRKVLQHSTLHRETHRFTVRTTDFLVQKTITTEKNGRIAFNELISAEDMCALWINASKRRREEENEMQRSKRYVYVSISICFFFYSVPFIAIAIIVTFFVVVRCCWCCCCFFFFCYYYCCCMWFTLIFIIDIHFHFIICIVSFGFFFFFFFFYFFYLLEIFMDCNAVSAHESIYARQMK